MRPLTPYEIFSFSVQPKHNTSAPTTDIATPANTVLLAMICLPLVFFSSVIVTARYQQFRSRLLKQQRMQLERVQYIAYKAK